MTIIMGLTLICFTFHIITIYCKASQEHMSTEDINNILDKLIQQTKTNETSPAPENFTPHVEKQPGNDSNIYYFKTYMAPHINYKTSSEMVHVTRRSNKTILEGTNEELTSDESFPGTSKITKKSFMEIENQKRFAPRVLYGRQDTDYKMGNVDESDYIFDDTIKKEMVTDFDTIRDNKQISFTQHGQQNQQLNLLHNNYPEIIIDQVTYDNDDNDKVANKLIGMKSTHEARALNEAKHEVMDANKNLKPILRSRIETPKSEEESEIVDVTASGNFDQNNYLTPEMKSLIEAIIQKQMLRGTLIKQTTENESQKQSILLEKILQRVSNVAQMDNARTSYILRQERFSPTEMDALTHLRGSMETLHGHQLSKPYLNGPYVRNKWTLRNRLLESLRRMPKPGPLRHTHLIASLTDRITSNIDYRPAYYGLFQK